jgi:predicted ABC-type sugar transport system permease subunit
MAAPLPLAFCAGLTLGLIDPELVTYASILEIILIVGAALIAVVTLRNIRKPEQPPQQ